MSWSNLTKPITSFTNRLKTLIFGLGTEDEIYFLTTEDDEILLVEPVAGGIFYSNDNKNPSTWDNQLK
jgi:hypothetical protein